MTTYDALPTGLQIGSRYRIAAVLGRGRSSAVYRALDTQTETPVALKIMDPALAEDPVAAERFVREAKILRTLDHPNVIKVYALLRVPIPESARGTQIARSESAEAWSVICMEYFDGIDGKAYLERYGPMSVRELLPVAASLIGAVGACHRLKVVHRDLKPQNVLINADGEVKIVDFGISKMQSLPDLTRTGTVFGTPQYLAPELFRSARADPRSDVYALGVVFYELLAGRPPYVATSLATIVTLQARGEIEPLSTFRNDVPPWLWRLIAKCLRVDPSDRYQSCYELLSDLQHGERTGAVHLDPAPTPCRHCKQELLAGLPFCPHCGMFLQLQYERGSKAVVLERCPEPHSLQAHLERTFRVRSAAAAAKLTRLPAVLFRGVSDATAASLAHQLRLVPCEVRITGYLATRLELRLAYAGLALMLLVPLFLKADSLSAAARAAIIVGAESAVLLVYWVQTRPLVPLRAGRAAAPRARPQAGLTAIARRLQDVHDRNLKAITARVVRSVVAVRERLPQSTAAFRAETIATLADLAIDAARSIEDQEVYLSSTSVNAMQAKCSGVERELQHATDSSTVHRLTGMKSACERELRHYLATQELHAGLYVGLVNLQTVMRRVEDAVERGDANPDAWTELRSVADDLAAARTEGRG